MEVKCRSAALWHMPLGLHSGIFIGWKVFFLGRSYSAYGQSGNFQVLRMEIGC